MEQNHQVTKPSFVWLQKGEWVYRCYVEASASDTHGKTYHARVECYYPDDPVAFELCRALAKRRANYLAERGEECST